MEGIPDLEAQNSERRHNHELEAYHAHNRWDSCCFRLNKEAVIFFSHYSILVILLIVSICGVFIDNKNSKDVWLNLLMLIIGAIMPAPTLKSHQKK